MLSSRLPFASLARLVSERKQTAAENPANRPFDMLERLQLCKIYKGVFETNKMTVAENVKNDQTGHLAKPRHPTRLIVE